jgi:hypothetical protein
MRISFLRSLVRAYDLSAMVRCWVVGGSTEQINLHQRYFRTDGDLHGGVLELMATRAC